LVATQSRTNGQSAEKLDKWEYRTVNHSQYLREGGSDLIGFNNLGREGWELASSYPIKGEIVVSVFKRRR
jgi:hypothetical protein